MPVMFISLVLITLVLMLGFVFYAILSHQLNEFERDLFRIKRSFMSDLNMMIKMERKENAL